MNQQILSNKEKEKNYIERIVDIRRVSKVVKGGRRFSFSALVVVGDGISKIGFGLGKANEVPDAIRKGKEKAQKKFINISKYNETFPHRIIGTFGAGHVLIMPASVGTGIIAGSVMRSIFEALGISDVLAKSIGTSNPHNIVRATINGLKQMRTYSEKISILKESK